MSIFVDAVDLEEFDRYGSFFNEQFQIFLEDGFKFVGVAIWPTSPGMGIKKF